MQIILTVMLTLSFGLALQQCPKPGAGSKSETSKNTATANANPQTTASTPIAAPADDAPRISLEDAKKDFDAGSVIIIDTRAEVAYKAEHIKGAINIPAEAFQTRYKEVPKGKKIIAYCS